MNSDTRYITPDAIGEVRRDIRESIVPAVAEVRQIFEENKAVDAPGWGAVGEWTVGVLYESLIESFLRDTDTLLDVLNTWEGEHLRFAEQNWRTAEDLAVQRVRRP
ncbi:hypothetical protein ACFOY2_02435 [Nonomuraea purpurea]|uniref:WXG100 family type VII secretion target n=1 Tax=Nonomuraea purpurea TaxID=1849276 RepID=A0ABV8FWL5_9ACTN